MKRRTALLGMLGAIPGLGLLKRWRKVVLCGGQSSGKTLLSPVQRETRVYEMPPVSHDGMDGLVECAREIGRQAAEA